MSGVSSIFCGLVGAIAPLKVASATAVVPMARETADTRTYNSVEFWACRWSAASLAADVAVAQPNAAGRVIAAWPSFALIGYYESVPTHPQCS
jgi:hypothetical protein